MKIIYYKKNFHIHSNNISCFNLLLQCLQHINDPNNINNYYLTSSQGHPLKRNHLMSNNETYYLKRRIKGASEMMKAGNTGPLYMTTGIFFGIFSVIVYFFYLKIILSGKADSVDRKIKVFAIEDMKKYQAYPKTGGAIENIQNGGQNTKELTFLEKVKKNFCFFLEKVKKFFCCLGDKIGTFICQNLQDKNIGTYLCYIRGTIPSFTFKEDEGSIAATVSSVLFLTYSLVIMSTLFSNSTTAPRKVCGSPNGGIVIIQLIFLALPLVLAFFSNTIALKFDELLKKFKKPPVMSNYKLLLCNGLLIFLMFIYMGINNKGISGAFVGVLIPVIILFALFEGIGGVSINRLLSGISRKISNAIIVTTIYNEVPLSNVGKKKASPFDPKYEPIPKSNENKKKLPFNNVAECFERFELIFGILKAAILAMIGYGFMGCVYPAQYKQACSRK